METETFQHYQILRRDDGSLWELGRGAMAVTYKAIDNNLRCPVALKVVSALNLHDEHTRARFVREARAAAALRHHNIASVYHLGSDEQSYFYAMEFVDGETVEDLVLRRGPLPVAEALGIAAQVARALGAAAKQELVHRDIKPANLMVVREDDEESLLVKVIDFGLARRAVLVDQSAQITLSGFVGTPQYASPEQIEERDLDSRSDIYSLGVTLWFMLTGQPPFSGSLAWISSQHLHSAPPWVAVRETHARVQDLLGRMLAKAPADRPQDPGKLRREIETCLEALATEPSAAVSQSMAREDAAVWSATVPAEDLAAAETVAPDLPEVSPQDPPPSAGETLAERFRLLESVGVGGTGQVFRATDAWHGDRPVAVKVVRPDLGLGRLEFHHLRGDLRRLRAAPHPHLVEVFALDQARGYRFVASEWINGFTLVDLLRHRGRLELPEALRLLADASAAAAHGSANGLPRLQLAPHQILVHFPAAFAGDKARAIRAMVDRPLAQWPEFGLKIDAIYPAREPGRTPAWADAMTLVPPAAGPGRDTPSSMRGLVAGSPFHALGALLYEMLNGTVPSATEKNGREAPPLPMLGEEANDLLRRALSPNPGFRHEQELFDALLAASGLRREELPRPSGHVPPVPFADPAAGATMVPSSEQAAGVASTVSLEAASVRMAPTIRTKLLRPRDGVVPSPAPARSGNPRRRVSPAWVAAGVAGLVGVAAVGGWMLWPQRSSPAPPSSEAVASPTPVAEEAIPPTVFPSPSAPGEETPTP